MTISEMNGMMADDGADAERHELSEAGPMTFWQKFKKKMFRMEMLLVWTVMGVVVGVALGGGLYNLKVSHTAIVLIGYPGELMIRALQELILPLMTFALMCGIFALRGTKTGSGKVARWAITYYVISMFVAVAIGISAVYIINPGKSRPFERKEGDAKCQARTTGEVAAANSSSAATTTLDSLLKLGRDLIPTNIVAAVALPNYLGLIVFAIIFALFLLKVGERAEPIIEMIEVLNLVTIKIIHLIIITTPIGITSWIAQSILQACNLGPLIKSLGLFVATVMGSIGVHFFIALPLTVLILSRRNPIQAFKSWLPAFAMALGTSSSAATMPVTMECGVKHGCHPAIVNFVIPLGTNINRDGTALYEAVAVIFICQAHGRDLSVGQVLVIVIVATLAAIGGAAVPHGGLVALITALQATGNSEFLSDLSYLYALDWLLAMFRTICNVWGDACATVVVDAWLSHYGHDIEMQPIQDDQASILEKGAGNEDVIHGDPHTRHVD
ncbi:hypothetical protein Mapa_002535 [Marchantia paleacea]|nr:hypothetical protein Mapa_002535 [Marchantia paleacea]